MKRRAFLTAAISPLFLGIPIIPRVKNFGWLENYPATNIPSLYSVSELKGFGENKVACLWKPWEQLNGHWKARKQLGDDCTGMASGATMDLLTAIQIILRKRNEQYIANSSTIAIYAGAREFGRGNYQKPSGGARGEWVVKYLRKYGNLLRIKYPTADLRKYSEKEIDYWDQNGLTKELLKEARKHPLLQAAKVRSWEELRDGIYGGNPGILCGKLGADDDERDQDGFIKPKGTWWHAWCIAGVQDGRRPGALLINSHGRNFGRGPKTYGQPNGSIWVDAKYIDKVLSKQNDSFVFSLFKGFKKPGRRYIIW